MTDQTPNINMDAEASTSTSSGNQSDDQQDLSTSVPMELSGDTNQPDINIMGMLHKITTQLDVHQAMLREMNTKLQQTINKNSSLTKEVDELRIQKDDLESANHALQEKVDTLQSTSTHYFVPSFTTVSTRKRRSHTASETVQSLSTKASGSKSYADATRSTSKQANAPTKECAQTAAQILQNANQASRAKRARRESSSTRKTVKRTLPIGNDSEKKAHIAVIGDSNVRGLLQHGPLSEWTYDENAIIRCKSGGTVDDQLKEPIKLPTRNNVKLVVLNFGGNDISNCKDIFKKLESENKLSMIQETIELISRNIVQLAEGYAMPNRKVAVFLPSHRTGLDKNLIRSLNKMTKTKLDQLDIATFDVAKDQEETSVMFLIV